MVVYIYTLLQSLIYIVLRGGVFLLYVLQVGEICRWRVGELDFYRGKIKNQVTIAMISLVK